MIESRRNRSTVCAGFCCALLAGCINHDQLILPNPSPCHVDCCCQTSPVAQIDPICHGYHQTCWQPWSAECPACQPPACGVMPTPALAPILQSVPTPLPTPEEVPQPLPQPQAVPSPEMPKELDFPTGPNSPHSRNTPASPDGARPQLASAQFPVNQSGQPLHSREAVPAVFSSPVTTPAGAEQAPTGHLKNVRANQTARSRAIAEGRLVDVSELAHQIGFQIPVAITPAVWSICVSSTADNVTPNSNERLRDVLGKLFAASRSAQGDWVLLINVTESRDGQPCAAWQMKACSARGENSENEITIMLPEESSPRVDRNLAASEPGVLR